jgi:hypothetical protein
MFSRDLLPDNVRCDPDKVRSSVLSSRNLQLDNVWLYQTLYGSTRQCPTDFSSLTFIHCFGHILLTGCPINPILFPLHL